MGRNSMARDVPSTPGCFGPARVGIRCQSAPGCQAGVYQAPIVVPDARRAFFSRELAGRSGLVASRPGPDVPEPAQNFGPGSEIQGTARRLQSFSLPAKVCTQVVSGTSLMPVTRVRCSPEETQVTRTFFKLCHVQRSSLCRGLTECTICQLGNQGLGQRFRKCSSAAY